MGGWFIRCLLGLMLSFIASTNSFGTQNQSFLKNVSVILDSIGKSGEEERMKKKAQFTVNADDDDENGEEEEEEEEEKEDEKLFNNFSHKLTSDISFPSLFVY